MMKDEIVTSLLNADSSRMLDERTPAGIVFLTFFIMAIIALGLALLIELVCKGGLKEEVTASKLSHGVESTKNPIFQE